jgi:hypothetical protein
LKVEEFSQKEEEKEKGQGTETRRGKSGTM